MTDVAISAINTSTPNSGTGDTIYAAFTKTNGNFGNLQTAVDNIQNNYANTTLGQFANISVTNRVLGSLNFYGSDTIYVNGSPVATSAATFQGGNVAGQANFTAGTSSTSNVSGAIVITGTGGLGVGGNVYASGVYINTGLYWAGNSSSYTTAYTSSGAGNITISGTTLALTATGPGSVSVGGSTAIPVITTDIYGRIIYSANAVVVAPAGTLTGTTLNSTVTASSLTTVGTLTGLTVSGNTAHTSTVYAQGIYDNGNRVVSTSSGAGNLSISGTAVTLPTTGPGAGTTGSATAIPVITTDAYGRISSITTAAVSSSSTLNLAGTSGTGAVSLTSQSLTFAGSNGMTANASGQTITISTPQNLQTTASPTFAGITTSATILPSANASINLGSTTAWWNNIYGTAVQAQYADLAEKYLADREYEIGTVVAIGGEAEVTACSQGDRAVGAVSANPAYAMNSGLDGGTYIALKGRVPIKVEGPVRKGQRLVAGDWGCACAINDSDPDVFAVALETNNNTGVNLVEALIL